MTVAPADPRPRLFDCLTPAECRVAIAVATSGLTHKEVGAKLFIEEKTVKYHVTNIFKKCGVSSKTQLAIAYAAEQAAEKMAKLSTMREAARDSAPLPEPDKLPTELPMGFAEWE